MPKHYGGNSNANKGRSDTDSGAMGSNKGATGGLKKSNEMRSDTTKTPNTRNPYPHGMA